MAIFNQPSPQFARSVWNLWLGVALITLLGMVIHGIIYGLTFKAMAAILAIGSVLFVVFALWLAWVYRRAQIQAARSVFAQDDTVRLKHE